jgi:NADH-quinone oxidoreductase subunit L
LAVALEYQPILGYLAMITVFMTAFYIFRVLFLTFGGEYRGGKLEEHAHGGHLHESAKVMIAPMVVLAILAVVSGWTNVSGQFSAFMGHEAEAPGFFGILAHPLPWIALIIAIAGIFLAYAIYSAKWLSAERIGGMFKPFYTLFLRKYFLDELYENIIVRIALIRGLFGGLQQIDTYGVDGAVNGLAKVTTTSGGALRRTETGQLQLYGLFIGIGVIAIAIVIYFLG